MDERKRSDGYPLMRRIILPLRERRPRRLWPILLGIVASLWLWSELRFSYEIVEIDDGSAPAAGPYMDGRTVDGRRVAASAYVRSTAADEPNIIFLEPYRTWMTRVALRFPPRNAGAAGPAELVIDGDFPLFRRCIAIVRWRRGIPQTEGCRQHERWRTLSGLSLG